MAVTISVIILGIIFVIIDIIPMYRNKEWASFFLSVTLLAIALIWAVLMDLEIEMPNPSEYIEKAVIFIFGTE